MLQQAIIAVAVLLAAGYVVWTFMPAPRRQRLLDALAARGLLRQRAARHRAHLASSGCGHCSAAGRHAPVRRKPAPR
jgi:hypothetical protein